MKEAVKEAETHKMTSYLSFLLDGEYFAVNVAKVIEILEVPNITKIPRAPEYMTGVINLRGSVLPIVDTRIKFGLPKIDFKVDTCIIVLDAEVEGETTKVGALVDAVLEVFDISEDKILPSPSINTNYNLDFISGMFRSDDGFVMLLNMDAVFSVRDVQLFNNSNESLIDDEGDYGIEMHND
jgi:purine-binding chemotaxis protein CheW